MKSWIAFGIVSLGVALLLLAPLIQTTRWSGRKSVEIRVHVIDSELAVPVANAEILVFDGPRTPIEGTIGRPSDFQPGNKSTDMAKYMTDEHGLCGFSQKFSASGSSGLFEDSGVVHTSGIWMRVSAPGRQVALIPLDRQSLRPRDIHDETPMWVTVVLNRIADARQDDR